MMRALPYAERALLFAGRAFLIAAAMAASARAAVENAPRPDDSWVRVGVVASAAAGLEGDRPLRFAFRDGERLAQMLGSVGQVDSANLFLIKARDRAGFKSQLGAIGARIADLKAQGRKVFLQFYYSGHGGARKFHLSDGPVPFDEVKQALGGDKADARVYVLDVCFGASFFNAKGFRTAPPVQLQMEMDPAARGEVTISSSSVDEQAYEVRTLGGSIFTSHWIMALRGAGDRNRDGQVTLFEAYNYAYDRTAGYSAETLDRPQHPSFQMDLTGARDMTLARLLRGGSGILFQGCPAGLYNVVDLQRGIQVGELRIPQGEEFTLALEPGRYRVQYQPSRGQSQAADLELTGSAMAHLPFSAFQAQAALPGLPKGSPAEEADAPVPPAAAPAPARGPTPLASFLERVGLTAWGGFALSRDDRLARGLARPTEVDQVFGTGGRFKGGALNSDVGVDLVGPLAGSWYAGGRLALGSAEYSLHSVGREPLGGLDSSERDAYPVTLDWTYSLLDLRPGFSRAATSTSPPGTPSSPSSGPPRSCAPPMPSAASIGPSMPRP